MSKPGTAKAMKNQRNPRLESAVSKRSVVLGGKKTSFTIEEPFWRALDEIATRQGVTRSSLIASVEAERSNANRSSALRVFVLENIGAALSQ
jgi:predicted DNA-binding ribbon-helix-helix protein